MDTPKLEVTPAEVQGARTRGEPLTLVDVREEWEWEIGHIDGSMHIPLSEIPGRIAELEHAVWIVAVCHKGARSMQAARFLKASGIEAASSLRGGIDAWSVDVDPGIDRY